MSRPVRLVGTFAPVPAAAGFVLPIFRAEFSNRHLVQVIDHRGLVSALVHEDVSPMDNVYNQDVWTDDGASAVYAVRLPNGGLEAGTREHLAQVLSQPIEDGEFDAVPVTRFRLSTFLRLSNRQTADALSAWTWVGATSTPWAANNWKVEGTIVPEFRRRIEFCLVDAGESEEMVQRICRGIEVNVDNQGRLALSVVVPGDGAEETRCREILARASDTLIGDASLWWPELRGNLPRVVIPPPPVNPEPERLPVWMAAAAKDNPWADWIKSTLAGAGYRINRWPERLDEVALRWGEPTHILPLLSEHSVESQWLESLLPTLDGRKVRPIRLQEVVTPLILQNRTVTDLWGILEEQAELRLLDAVGGPAPGWTFSPPANRPPFPGAQTIHNLPPRQRFVGREKEFKQLLRWELESVMGEGTEVLISGIRGIGKTAFVIEAAYRGLARFRVIWWISATNIKAGLAGLAKHLGFDAPDQSALADIALAWLAENKYCMVIVDDIIQNDDFECFMSRGIYLILISTFSISLGIDRAIILPELSKSEARALLVDRWGRSGKFTQILSDELWGIPRAIIEAVRSEEINSDRDVRLFIRRVMGDCVHSLSEYVDNIEARCSGATKFLKMVSCFGDNLIPRRLWNGVLDSQGGSDLRRNLIDAGVIFAHTNGRIKVMRPIRGAMLKATNKYERESILRNLTEACLNEFGGDHYNTNSKNLFGISMACVESIIISAEKIIQMEGAFSRLCCWVVSALLFQGKYARASDIALLARKNFKPSLFNMDAAADINLISGRVAFSLGDYAESHRAFSEAVTIAHKAELQGVAAEASVWAGLSLLRAGQDGKRYPSDQYVPARMRIENFVDNCRRVSTRTLGKEIIRVLGGEIHEQSAVLREAFSPDFPADEPDTIQVWRIIGRQHLQRGQPDQACVLLKAAEVAATHIWGKKHPEVAEALADLTEAQMAMGIIKEAKRNAEAALGIASRKLGRKHPLTVRLMNVVGDDGRSISAAFDDGDEDEFAIEIEGVPDNDP
jgi:hypothetical protein